MDRGYGADSRLTRSSSVVESGTSGRRWKPTGAQKRILESLFASGTRNPSMENINQITAELLSYGPVEGKNVFFWFQNAAAREKRKRDKPESSTKWPSVLRPRNWPSLFRSKKSAEESAAQEEEVTSATRRNSSVDPSEIRTLDLFPLYPDK